MYQFGLDEDIDDITSETITTSSIPRGAVKCMKKRHMRILWQI